MRRDVVWLCWAVGAVLCGAPAGVSRAGGLLGPAQQRAERQAVAGVWAQEFGKATLRLDLREDGSFAFGPARGTYTAAGTNLTLVSQGGPVAYRYRLSGDQLTVSDGDLASPVTFQRMPVIRNYMEWCRGLSFDSLKPKLYRILTVLAIAAFSRLLIVALSLLSRFMVHSEWGPLRFAYRYSKNRALTIHSVVLNLIKYVVYFTALGFILSELGINYNTYIASLSVIGLAIGFGSQGLVQDVVTGFFLVFEGQFEVGDMVEISGQTGIVEELGLRMTRLRNYVGQKVLIPNRNISSVANYVGGGQQASVDVPIVGGAGERERAIALLNELGRDFSAQFAQVVLSGPSVHPAQDDGLPVRLSLVFWPQQQAWLIDQQLVPRIKETLKEKGVQVREDQVACFYLARSEQRAFSLHDALGRLRFRKKPPAATP